MYHARSLHLPLNFKRLFRSERFFRSFASRFVAGEEDADNGWKWELCFKKELLQSINQVSFAIDDLLLFLDTHPREKRALEYFSELSARRNELLKKYAELHGPLTVDTANDSCLRSWQWMEQPFPWEQEGGCR